MPETELIMIVTTRLNPFSKLQNFKAWDEEIGKKSENLASYVKCYVDPLLTYWESNL
jgi:hypothetical protein